MEVVEVSERMKAKEDDGSKRYCQALFSFRMIVKVSDECKDKTVDTLTMLRLLYKEG